MSQCRACKATITWIKTIGGRLIPLDVLPVSDGNIVIQDGMAVTLSAVALRELAGLPPEKQSPRYRSHFSTCPAAWRSRKRRPAAAGRSE